ncbi:hypothetical protein DL767_006408 [Monosporascus sp. MG133]|nr:hypothetical protein DL767_006408 [Monosporascus sp. MG133]
MQEGNCSSEQRIRFTTGLGRINNGDCTLRSVSQESRLFISPEHAAQLSSVNVPDTITVESYEDALGGITGITHTVSLFVLSPKGNVKDLLEPAIDGSVAILEAAKRLVATCPPWVFGPYAQELKDTKHLSESPALMWGIAWMKEIPPFDFVGCADSRDVAATHILALEARKLRGSAYALDGSELSNALGLKYRMLVETVTDTYGQLFNAIQTEQSA